MIIDQDLDRHRGEQRDRSRDSEHGMFLFISNSSKFVNLNGSLFGISSICLYLYVMYVMYVIYVIYVTIPSYIYKVNIYTHIYIYTVLQENVDFNVNTASTGTEAVILLIQKKRSNELIQQE